MKVCTDTHAIALCIIIGPDNHYMAINPEMQCYFFCCKISSCTVLNCVIAIDVHIRPNLIKGTWNCKWPYGVGDELALG